MLPISVDTAWNRLIPWKTFKLLIRLYFSCFLYYIFLFYIKSLSMVRYLFMWGKRYVSHLGRYVLKQGNPLKKNQIANKIILFLFYFLWFSFYIQNFIKGKIFVYVQETICRPLRQLRPETGESLANF